MFGAVFGDVIGSYYELEGTKDYDFELHRESTFTDDTVLTVAVCKAILENPKNITGLKLWDRAREYAAQYKLYYSRYPYAGFGQMFTLWAKDSGFTKVPSYGNGAAMRVVPIGFAYDDINQVMLQAKASCLYTHNNKEAIKGAQSVAAAVFMARKGSRKEEIRSFIQKTFGYDLSYTIDEIREDYCFEIRCDTSVPQAIVAFLDSYDYESAVRNAISLGGDSDTQATIAGGIAQAYYQEIPKHLSDFCLSRIDGTLKDVIREFEGKYLTNN